ncbi:M20/M25/M40 family metallo-hydrolase [Nicoliella spurrieriana]|uniref:M20/M25/M40 family metallo-hydrolase n=1 Tax=Nicoliella spurrieriana TaxID=2925830 RepID=A0A976X576_9LACO|nr:M20/M25/M40 family metallo-hydrolase [Nicoliella spurrieriana]UQS86252.1 M20/M25/M40 family metallo-hydrolase [Nicoliella spurrieriana]
MEKEAKIKILKDLIDIKSVNDNESEVAQFLLELFQAHGIEAKLVAEFHNRSNIVAEIGTGEHPKIAFAGHLDTVHQGDERTWKSDPFQGTLRKGRMYGRGTTDMKAGLADLAIAMIELKESDTPIQGTIRFIGTIGEELTAAGSKFLTDKGYVDDLDAMVIAEPSGVSLHGLRSYVNSDGVTIDPEVLTNLLKKAFLSDALEQHFIIKAHKGWMAYRVTARGKAAHSSMPQMGINAINTLIQYYLAEKEFYAQLTESDPELGRTIYSPDIFHGGEQINSVPDLAYEIVKVRTIPQVSNEELIRRLKQLIVKLNAQPGIDLELTVEHSELPVKSDNHTHLIDLFQKHAAHTMHEPDTLPTIGVSLGTDASEFRRRNQTMDVVVLGPGNTTAHSPNEYVEISTYLDMIKLYKATVIDFLAQNQG